MLFDPEIAEYYRERVDFEGLPIHVHGLVIPVYRQAHLKDVLADGLRPEARRDIWLRAKAAAFLGRSVPSRAPCSAHHARMASV